MNSDHAPTAEEQLPPLAIVYAEEMRESQAARYDAILRERERQLLAALRENREKDELLEESAKREFKWASDFRRMENRMSRFLERAEAAEAKLRAVSDALQEASRRADVDEFSVRWTMIEPLLARIRAIVDSVPGSPQPPR